MRHRTLAAAALLLACAAAVAAQQPQQPAPQQPPPVPKSSPSPSPSPAPQAQAAPRGNAEAKRKYDAMLEAAKKSEGAVDYKALRMAYFETPDYDPLAGSDSYHALWRLAEQQNWAEAVRQAAAALERNYLDISAHLVAHAGHRQLGDAEKAEHHRRWADGLIASIKGGNDGKSVATAWEVISISEEYAVLRAMNLRRTMQLLIRKDGHSYDEMKVIDPQTNARFSLYFNVDKPVSAYGRK
jgi:hypothetical protein